MFKILVKLRNELKQLDQNKAFTNSNTMPQTISPIVSILIQVGPYIVLVLCALYIQAISLNVSIARSKYSIKTPLTVGHDGFERSFRAHLNMVENFVVFLPIYLVCIQFPNVPVIQQFPIYLFTLGVIWLVSRIVSGLNYINNWNKKLGYAMYIISLLVTISLVGILFTGLYIQLSDFLSNPAAFSQGR
jgi:glutathione S-transferase